MTIENSTGPGFDVPEDTTTRESTPEPVSSNLQAARILFRSAHALEEAVSFLEIPFATEMSDTMIASGWRHGIKDSLDAWKAQIANAANALIDEAIREELKAGEADWIAEAVRMRIDSERGNPVTFPLDDPPT